MIGDDVDQERDEVALQGIVDVRKRLGDVFEIMPQLLGGHWLAHRFAFFRHAAM